MQEPLTFGDLIGTSDVMRCVFSALAQCAASDATVLIEGETGTGKEGAAHAIHAASSRAHAPFVVVDCGAVANSLIESELFGHERGAFTDAVVRRTGAFEEADGGTIFLDELGELPLSLQPKLLRVLEQKTVRRVGSGEQHKLNVRIVAATHRDLRREMQEGRFRPDLYFRLSVLKVNLPPLAARKEDVPALVGVLLDRFGVNATQRARFTAPDFLASVAAAPWPGNVRELRNYLERCLVMDKELPMSELLDTQEREAPAYSSPPSGQPIDASVSYEEARKRAIAAFERTFLEALLDRSQGNVSRAARDAGMDRVYLHRLIRRHALR